MNMATQMKTPRELDSRDATVRPRKWQPPQLLPDPTPEPGYVFRYIRTSVLNHTDPLNLSSKLREGWEPVKASDHPELQMYGSQNARFPDAIEIGGLLLCKTPVEFVEQRDAYYREQAANQMLSVDNTYMRDENSAMPKFKERKSEVSFGKGN